MQDSPRTSTRVLNPVAIAALVVMAPLCGSVGDSATLAQREVACVTQARAEALVRCVSEAARRWRHDNLPAPTWICPNGAALTSIANTPSTPLLCSSQTTLFFVAPLLELDLDLPPPSVRSA